MLTGQALGTAIAQALADNGKTQADAARFFGVKPPSVTGWIKTGRINKSNFDKLRIWLDKTPDSHWGVVSAPLGQLITSHEDDESQGFKIPQFDTGGSMGRGVLLRDQPGVIKSWTVSDSWLQQNVHRMSSVSNLCIVTGFGPSMQPLFNPGDPLLVDRGINRVDVDAVYFFRIGEEGFIKQVQRLYNGVDLVLRAKSYNPMYDPFDIPQTADFEVFGRVLKVWEGKEF